MSRPGLLAHAVPHRGRDLPRDDLGRLLGWSRRPSAGAGRGAGGARHRDRVRARPGRVAAGRLGAPTRAAIAAMAGAARPGRARLLADGRGTDWRVSPSRPCRSTTRRRPGCGSRPRWTASTGTWLPKTRTSWRASTGGRTTPRADDSARVVVGMAPRQARYVRLSHLGGTPPGEHWSIAELFAYEAATTPWAPPDTAVTALEAARRELAHGADDPTGPHPKRAPVTYAHRRAQGRVGTGVRGGERGDAAGARVGGGSPCLRPGAGAGELVEGLGRAGRRGPRRPGLAGDASLGRAGRRAETRVVALGPSDGRGGGADRARAGRRGRGVARRGRAARGASVPRSLRPRSRAGSRGGCRPTSHGGARPPCGTCDGLSARRT